MSKKNKNIDSGVEVEREATGLRQPKEGDLIIRIYRDSEGDDVEVSRYSSVVTELEEELVKTVRVSACCHIPPALITLAVLIPLLRV